MGRMLGVFFVVFVGRFWVLFSGFGWVLGGSFRRVLEGPVGFIGDLWMRLQLLWLQFEVVRSPVGVVWGRFGALWAPSRPQIDP